jgi:hypothetical protein
VEGALKRRISLLFLLVAAYAFGGPNLIQNSSFENFSVPNVTNYSYTGVSNSTSVAANWGTWNNTNATTTTLLCPDDPLCPNGGPAPIDGQRMLYVTTNGAFNGIWQAWDVPNAGNTNATTNAWVYIVSGQVMVGTGNDGSTVAEMTLTQTGTWLNLTWFNSAPFNKPANELIFYSNAGPATFYVDATGVFDGIPEPATFALTGLTIAVLGFTARKRSLRRD